MHEMTAPESVMVSFCTFRAEGRLYAINLRHLREVSTIGMVTPVPQAPPGVRGLVNLRSRIYLVLDLRCLLGMPPVECRSVSRLLIFKPGVLEDTGLLVDTGGDVVKVAAEQIENTIAPGPNGESSHAASTLIIGVGKLKPELMMIIDPMRIADAIANGIRCGT